MKANLRQLELFLFSLLNFDVDTGVAKGGEAGAMWHSLACARNGDHGRLGSWSVHSGIMWRLNYDGLSSSTRGRLTLCTMGCALSKLILGDGCAGAVLSVCIISAASSEDCLGIPSLYSPTRAIRSYSGILLCLQRVTCLQDMLLIYRLSLIHI